MLAQCVVSAFVSSQIIVLNNSQSPFGIFAWKLGSSSIKVDMFVEDAGAGFEVSISYSFKNLGAGVAEVGDVSGPISSSSSSSL